MTTTKLPNHTALLKECLTPRLCDNLITAFNLGDQEVWDRDGAPKFTQVNLNKSHPDLIPELVEQTRFALKIYSQLFPITRYLPTPKSLEEFRVKRYNSGADDRYDMHVDVEGLSASSRYLAFLFYLNDDFSGGETEFAEGASVVPATGSALVFPPYWMYPHAGRRVTTGTKYIMSTYLHLT